VIAALKGANDFDAEDGEYYLGLARQMKRLARSFRFRFPGKKLKESNRFSLLASNSRPVPFVVVFIGQELFKQIVSGTSRRPRTTRHAQFKDISVAHAAARILNEIWDKLVFDSRALQNECRAPETFIDKLSDVGFERKTIRSKFDFQVSSRSQSLDEETISRALWL